MATIGDGSARRYPRVLAICVFRHQEEVLVAECLDSVKGETFYRPLGGSVEFGEHSEDAVEREIREEIGTEIEDLRYLGLIENIFTYEGEVGHEVVFVYEGNLADPELYRESHIPIADDPRDLKAVWKPLGDFRGSGAPPLYPTGLLDILP